MGTHGPDRGAEEGGVIFRSDPFEGCSFVRAGEIAVLGGNMGTGSAPTNFATCSVEIMVNDYAVSLAFWCDVLKFMPVYTRPKQKFAYLQRADGAQMMMYERDGDWETGPMEVPFGRGAVIQLSVTDIDALAAQVAVKGVAFYVGLREKWRDWGDCLGGQREFLVQDPDGYLVMVSQKIGTRPLA